MKGITYVTLLPNMVTKTIDDLILTYGILLFQQTSKEQYLNNDMHMKKCCVSLLSP